MHYFIVIFFLFFNASFAQRDASNFRFGYFAGMNSTMNLSAGLKFEKHFKHFFTNLDLGYHGSHQQQVSNPYFLHINPYNNKDSIYGRAFRYIPTNHLALDLKVGKVLKINRRLDLFGSAGCSYLYFVDKSKFSMAGFETYNPSNFNFNCSIGLSYILKDNNTFFTELTYKKIQTSIVIGILF